MHTCLHIYICVHAYIPTYVFIHSGHFYSAPSSPPLLRAAPDYSMDYSMSEFHAEASQATASEGLAQGLYVAARTGVEPTTLRLKVIVSTKTPPRPTYIHIIDIHTLVYTYIYANIPKHVHAYMYIIT